MASSNPQLPSSNPPSGLPSSSSVKHITPTHSALEEILRASGKTQIIVIDWYAPWCMPCKRIAPFYESLVSKYPQFTFYKIDGDAYTGIDGADSFPTFQFYRGGVLLNELTVKGASEKNLENAIKKLV